MDNRATGGEMPPSDRQFDEPSFWAKIKKHPHNIGKPILENALVLYFCLKDPETPFQIKGAIIAVLAYFVMPLDVVTDFLPAVGYGDDFSALIVTLGTFFQHIKPEHRIAAQEKLDQWFVRDESATLKQQELQQYLQVLLVALLKVEYGLDPDLDNLKVIIDFTRKKIQEIKRLDSHG
ncbi:YkvA family protein [Picosynechococcus sp. PCC 7003]|uniref:YkvA family protein n=1 Tax=Picosynechococcus sp. PCC 7003 TaxID=374981 RepID=UPI001E347B65|nr:YkvA family protein [Picosynechococcus sp. PCC 7003]